LLAVFSVYVRRSSTCGDGMTPEKLLEINPKLGTVASFMKAHPECTVRFWEDATVDITLPANVRLDSFLAQFVCPSCGQPATGPGLQENANIKGTFRGCDDCGIRFFIHSRVKFGGSPT